MAVSDPIEMLTDALAQLPPGAIVVGYSGGVDSTTLLHALAQIPAARARGLRALHVDHRLHAHSAHWVTHCRGFAAQLGIELEDRAIAVATVAGTGPEDAARQARGAAFAAALRPGELLALAHHRDDQAETVLLKLLRGAGPEGLGGMRSLRAFAQGFLWRPLLDLPRSTLRSYAQKRELDWIEDPSNTDTRLRRNFLRAQVLPGLEQHWPQAAAAIAHSASWSRAAAEFIDGEATRALAHIQGVDPATLFWHSWLQLPVALRDPVLRRWLRDLHLPEPAHFHVAELERQLRSARSDRLPCVNWAGAEVRRYRDLLYAMAPLAAISDTWELPWNGAPLALPDGGRLALEPAAGTGGATNAALGTNAGALRVRYRRGGERIRPAGSNTTRELRLLLQEAGIEPWRRARIPLVYRADELLAVADLWLSGAGREHCERLQARIVWTPATAPGISEIMVGRSGSGDCGDPPAD